MQYQLLQDGKIEYLHSGINGEIKEYHIVIDHVLSYPAELDIKISKASESEAFPVGLVIGVAVRIKATVKSNEGTLSVQDIPSLIAHAKNQEGRINAEIEIIGIKNSAILKLPRFQGELNKDTLGTILQNIATINAEIDNSETEIVPQIIGGISIPYQKLLI